ncbi:unnamed protein product [Bursaphelenchus okinawaensis]|uniref:Lipase domain-containing protein n=1 Tax=Bursaphelenchus okinawaensis TaxID=465554 RepID=A0A811K2M6_9BILA|nr:unnamed protein product [Bursaphelenchus okinawaensis]CAG9089941.1 unnamed protein product [Bursaphelenchus okinawaensis]
MGDYHGLRDEFMRRGYKDSEVYGTTYGKVKKQVDVYDTLECQFVNQIRHLILAVSAYTQSRVYVIANSLGGAISRKAILGGECVDTLEDLGPPITNRIEAYLGVAGAMKGCMFCIGIVSEFIPICSKSNGLYVNSQFIRDINNRQKYESSRILILESSGDDVIGFESLNHTRLMEIDRADHIIILTIINGCSSQLTVVKTVASGAQTTQCTLPAGGLCTQTFTVGAMNFRDGFGHGKTIAEFSFGATNPNGASNYALNVIEGFDIAMQIIPENGCHVATCANAACPDAYHNSNDNHTYGVVDGTAFILSLCKIYTPTNSRNCTPPPITTTVRPTTTTVKPLTTVTTIKPLTTTTKKPITTTTPRGPISTSLTITNRCTNSITVVKTVAGGTQTVQCQLAVGASCTQSYITGVMNFRNGFGSGHTIAEFSFGNPNGNTNYALNVIEGFDIGMQIIPQNGGHVAQCATASCPDAYHNSNDNHTYGVPAGNPMVLNLCQFQTVTTTTTRKPTTITTTKLITVTTKPTTTTTTGPPSTNLTITNDCSQSVTVVKTVASGAQTTQCQLASGQSCSQSYVTGVMNFRGGTGTGHTIAEFSFGNPNGNTNYDLNVIEGYDIPMQIKPANGGHVSQCNSPSCPDAYHSSSDNKTYGVPGGVPIALNLCYLGS